VLSFAEKRVAVLFVGQLLARRLVRLRDARGRLAEVCAFGNRQGLLESLVARTSMYSSARSSIASARASFGARASVVE
jgi:hypothetical protein